MPELRQNFATKEWVIIATERAKRPEEMATHRAPRNPVSFNPKCPFCPGNESITPPEVMRIPADGGAWNVRVVPNKFAALSRDAQPKRVIHRQRRSIPVGRLGQQPFELDSAARMIEQREGRIEP